ncbi:exosortase A [Photobacterium halotolerans]|uniref:Exosortase A n=1 Tax=Photobacterium halotolerans TaxID=265726 RepID=A0A7X4WCN2_9GAMM|nr:exosortase A [Photobacterium halotolerans]NAW66218.1 exosortase A [Photobacterium halotolerans]
MSDRIGFRLALPVIGWLWLFWPSLSNMVNVWAHSKTYEHCFLVVPICLWLVWRERKAITPLRPSVSWLAAALLAVSCFLWLLARAASIGLFEHITAIVSLQLLLWAVLGTAIIRRFWFPLLYLLFAVPFGESLVPRLQIITADLSVWLLNISQIPVYREGLYLTIPNGRFYVAEACSGIRFLMSSVALGTLFAYLQFTRVYKRTLFVAFSFIFPIIANGIRAYGIVIIGYFSNMEYAAGADHLVYGWLFFSVVILVIFFTASLFSDPQASSVDLPQQPSAVSARQTWGALGMVALIFIATALWKQQLDQSQPLLSNRQTDAINPQSATLTEWGISFPHAERSQRQSTADGKAELYTARYNIWQRDGELISSTNQLFNKDIWSVDNSQSVTLPAGIHAKSMTVSNAKGSSMRVIYWYCVNGFCSSNPLAIKLMKASYRLAGQQGVSDVFAIASTELSDDQIKDIIDVGTNKHSVILKNSHQR